LVILQLYLVERETALAVTLLQFFLLLYYFYYLVLMVIHWRVWLIVWLPIS